MALPWLTPGRSPSLETGRELPVFDIVMLGVGPDGHVASLFPETPGVLVTTGYGDRRARLPQTAAGDGSASPSLPSTRRSASGWHSPEPTRPARSDSRLPERARSRYRRQACTARSAPSSSSTLLPQPRFRKSSSPRTTERGMNDEAARTLSGPLRRASSALLGRDACATRAKGLDGLVEKVGRLLLGATLLHVGEVRLVRLELRERWAGSPCRGRREGRTEVSRL